MAKISDLVPIAEDDIDGSELVPAVKNGETRLAPVAYLGAAAAVVASQHADRAEAAAGKLETITRIGSPDTPKAGTPAGDSTFVEATAAPRSQLYTHATFYAMAAGTVRFLAADHSGTAFSVKRYVEVEVAEAGQLVTAAFPQPLLLAGGEKPGIHAPGIIPFNSPADPGRGIYGSGPGFNTAFNDAAAFDGSLEYFLHRSDATVAELASAQEAISQAAVTGPPDWVENADRFEIDFTRGLLWNPDRGRAEPLGDQLFVATEEGCSLDTRGRLVRFPANAPRMTDRGLRIEAFDTTNLLAAPFSPATQTLALAAGTYAASCGLGGEVGISGGATDVVRSGLPVVFTLLEPADVTFTVLGAPQWIQCQAGEFATMPVDGTRKGDVVTPNGRLAEVLGGAAYTAIVEVENIMPNVNVATAAPILGGAGTAVVLNRRLASNSAGMFVSGGASINHTFTGTFEQIVRAVVTGDATTAAISANGRAATSDADPLPATRWLGRDGSTVSAGGPQSGLFIRKIAFEPAAVSTAEAALLSAPPERIRTETIHYPSSIDPGDFPTLDATVCYDEQRPNAPVLVIMHGWAQSMTDFTEQTYHRLARRGFFVVAPNMRGRPDALFAARDASAREIVDILDAVDMVRARYPEFAHARDAYMFGYSGGGGNVLATAMKAPDAFNLFVSHFGMSDYGYDATYGWHTTDPGFASEISTAVGGAPGASAAVNAAYRSRYAIEGVPANLQGGHLIMLHDVADALVDVEHSRQMAAAMAAAGNPRWSFHESAVTSWNRWEHGLPNDLAKVVRSENLLLPAILRNAYRAWTFPLAGTARVHGFLRTRHFEIVLDDRKSSVATVEFDVTARSYTVTPVSTNAPIDVTVRQGTLTATQTIDAPTVLVAA